MSASGDDDDDSDGAAPLSAGVLSPAQRGPSARLCANRRRHMPQARRAWEGRATTVVELVVLTVAMTMYFRACFPKPLDRRRTHHQQSPRLGAN